MQRFYLFLIIIFAGVNFVGALGPELGFDALWYHLTIPKLYLTWQEIKFIPGGLLYYSAMPKLGEIIYMLGGANFVFAHLVNWVFGLGTVYIIHKITKNWLAPLIFYVTPIVGWLSGSAYIDLTRTFFEVLAFYYFINKKYLFTGLALGLAVSTKTLSVGSVGVFLILFFIKETPYKGVSFLKSLPKFLIPVVVVSAPWFIISYLWTGYPFFPIGAGILDHNHNLVFPNILDLFKLFTTSPDPISPIYLIALPFIITKPYVFLTALLWLITPRTDWGRFMLPYLPVWAIYISQVKNKFLIFAVIFISIINIGYRVMAQRKLIPYITGRQTQTEYLSKNLDFKTSVFVDCDGKITSLLKPADMVLVQNIRNLYYINFPYVHESWYKNEKVTHILTYNKVLDKKLLYGNNLTGMRLYDN